MTTTAPAPAAPPAPPVNQQLPGVPALNDPAALAKRQQSHPAFNQQQAPEVAQGPNSLPATPTPVAPAAPAPAPVQQAQTLAAPQPVPPPVAAPTAPQQINIVPDTNLLAAVTPPELKYVQPQQPETPEPTITPQMQALQDQLDALTKEKREQEAAERRQALLAPRVDYSAVGDIDPDQAEALHRNLVVPQLEPIVAHFEQQLTDMSKQYEARIAELSGVGSQVQQVQQQQEISEAARWRQTNAAVQAANPTFEADLNDPTFIAAAGHRYNDILQAYHSHDTAHVNASMAYVKQQMQQPITGVEGQAVGGAPTATTSPPPANEVGQVKQSDISRNIENFQQKRITREQFNANVQRFKAAQEAGLVVDG